MIKTASVEETGPDGGMKSMQLGSVWWESLGGKPPFGAATSASGYKGRQSEVVGQSDTLLPPVLSHHVLAESSTRSLCSSSLTCHRACRE